MTRSRVWKIFGAIAVTATLAPCGEENLLGPNPGDVIFNASLGIDLSSMTEKPSGLFFEDLEVGTGDLAASGDAVTVFFSVWLADGDLIDRRTDTFVLGSNDLLLGVEEGRTGMQVGGIRMLVVPSSLGYGEGGSGDTVIPSNAVLVFRLEVTEIVKPGA